MRWRLRLSEFDFTVKYKKGAANTQADALSRLPTTGYTQVDVDEEIPCLQAEQAAKSGLTQPHGYVEDYVATSGLEGPDGNANEPLANHGSRLPTGNEDANLVNKDSREPTGHCGGRVANEGSRLPTGYDDRDGDEFMEWDYDSQDAILATEETLANEAQLQPVTVQELLQAQQFDAFCMAIRERLNAGHDLPFEANEAGLLERRVERYQQVIVPPDLRPRILYAGHHAKLAGAPGGRKLYMTLRREYYWPTMAMDCYATVRNCAECAKNRLKLRRNAAPMQLFPATSPLESVSIDILGDLIQTPRGHRYLLVICDRFTKLVRTVPLGQKSPLAIARAFLTNWVFVYGPPVDLLSDNGKQFASRLFQEVCRILGVKNRFTSTYHPQCNGQVERFNRTLLSAIRHYVGDHPKEWDLFTDALTFAYNTQTHATTGLSPFELILSKPPRAITMETLPTLRGESPSSYHQRWLQRLRALMDSASGALKTTQERYKRNFCSIICPIGPDRRRR